MCGMCAFICLHFLFCTPKHIKGHTFTGMYVCMFSYTYVCVCIQKIVLTLAILQCLQLCIRVLVHVYILTPTLCKHERATSAAAPIANGDEQQKNITPQSAYAATFKLTHVGGAGGDVLLKRVVCNAVSFIDDGVETREGEKRCACYFI